jgi:hypothetical protein
LCIMAVNCCYHLFLTSFDCSQSIYCCFECCEYSECCDCEWVLNSKTYLILFSIFQLKNLILRRLEKLWKSQLFVV